MIKNLDLKNINKLKRYFTLDYNTNSKIYYEKGILHKVTSNIRKKQIESLKFIEKNKIKGIVKITSFITNKDKVVGYSVVKCKNKSLKKQRFRNIENKIKDCKGIIKLACYFNKNDLIYGDYHVSNFLLNKKTHNSKICDLESFYISTATEDKNHQLRAALKLCISYIYNIHPEYASIIVDHSNIKIDRNNCLRECIDSIGKNNFYEKVKNLENIDKTHLLEDRKLIKEEVSEYLKSGYYRGF